MATRTEAFDDLVVDVAQGFREALGRRWAEIEFAVEDVPSSDPDEWLEGVPLARMWPARGLLPTRIVLYRRPIEAAAHGAERANTIHRVLLDQLALLLGVDPEEIDPGAR